LKEPWNDIVHGSFFYARNRQNTEGTVFDVEPFGHELKAEGLRRNEKKPVFIQGRLQTGFAAAAFKAGYYRERQE
jgi:hypothetical protein